MGTGATTATFTTSLPIQAGDAIGIENSAAAETIGGAALTGTRFLFWTPSFAEGETRATPSGGVSDAEFAFNADVVATPTVTGLSPSSGPPGGGTSVLIFGTDFSETTTVKFGETAARFIVNSDTQITAVSPASGVGAVDVRVSTPAGTSPVGVAGRFRFEAPLPPPSPPAAPLSSPLVIGKLGLIGSPRATSSGVRMTVSCSGPTAGRCSLTAKLTTVQHKRGTRTVGVVAAGSARTTVGTRKLTVLAGRQAAVTVTLNATGKRLLERFRRLSVTLTTTYTATNAAAGKLAAKRLTIRRRSQHAGQS